jgi:acyl-homoserine lactone acylase PvdQ
MHVVAATVDNHLLYQQSGINPLRRNVTMGSYLKDGTTSENDWLGFMPAHERMHAFDPKKGYLATSNQRVTS